MRRKADGKDFNLRAIRFSAATAPFAALLLAAGCGSVRPVDAQATASPVRAALADAFANDARFADRVDVAVSAARGVVTLSGVVATAADVEEAAKLASSVPGVAVLYNLLEVENGARPASRAEVVAGAR